MGNINRCGIRLYVKSAQKHEKHPLNDPHVTVQKGCSIIAFNLWLKT